MYKKKVNLCRICREVALPLEKSVCDKCNSDQLLKLGLPPESSPQYTMKDTMAALGVGRSAIYKAVAEMGMRLEYDGDGCTILTPRQIDELRAFKGRGEHVSPGYFSECFRAADGAIKMQTCVLAKLCSGYSAHHLARQVREGIVSGFSSGIIYTDVVAYNNYAQAHERPTLPIDALNTYLIPGPVTSDFAPVILSPRA